MLLTPQFSKSLTNLSPNALNVSTSPLLSNATGLTEPLLQRPVTAVSNASTNKGGNKMARYKKSIMRFRCAILVFGLGLLSAEQAMGESVGKVTQPLVRTDSTVLWTQNGNLIPMCWHQLLQFPDTNAENAAKAFVAQTIRDGWINRVNLRITWVDCPTSGSTQHVRVKLRIGDPGYNGTTLKPGMATLSTAAQRIVPPPNDPPGLLMGFRSDWNQSNETRASFRSLILHEFGHVLGFDHEQIRPDTAPTASCYGNTIPNAIKIGPADLKSIMGWSYCTEALGILTLNDIQGVRSIYGRRNIFIRGVLLAGKFRTQAELNGMSPEDQRNTLIVELSGRTNQSVGYFQSLDDVTLGGTGALLIFLREAKIRTDAQLRTMSDDNQRNTLISVFQSKFNLPASQFQGMSNADLVLVGLGGDQATRGIFPGRVSSYIPGVLLAGKFRTQDELNRMSSEDQRNTLIVELSGKTNQPVGHFQSLNDATLAGTGAVLVFLREAKIRTDAQLKTISDDDQRNLLIIEIGSQTGLDSQLQSLSNMDLVRMAFGVVP